MELCRSLLRRMASCNYWRLRDCTKNICVVQKTSVKIEKVTEECQKLNSEKNREKLVKRDQH